MDMKLGVYNSIFLKTMKIMQIQINWRQKWRDISKNCRHLQTTY